MRTVSRAVAQVPQDMELVEDDLGLRGVAGLERRGAEGLPHVHDGQADSPGFLGAEPGIEGIHAGFGAVGAAEPDGPAAQQVADDDAVRVPGADGEFVDADDLGSRAAGAVELLPHVLLVELLDGVPIEVQVLGHVLDGGDPAVAADAEGEALGVKRVVGEPVEAFALHGLALPAEDAADGEFQVDAPAAAVEVADPSRGLIVEGAMAGAAHSAACFFRRRRRRDDDGVGIAEEAANGRRGDEARERVEVAESAEVGHAAIVTSLAPAKSAKSPRK